MNRLKNKVQLIGNVGEDPTITELENKKKKARFPLATNETFKNEKGERQTLTNWHTIVAWGKIAEIVEQHVAKGREIALEGKLSTRSYEDRDGVKRDVTEVTVLEILLLRKVEKNQDAPDENAL